MRPKARGSLRKTVRKEENLMKKTLNKVKLHKQDTLAAFGCNCNCWNCSTCCACSGGSVSQEVTSISGSSTSQYYQSNMNRDVAYLP